MRIVLHHFFSKNFWSRTKGTKLAEHSRASTLISKLKGGKRGLCK